MDNYNNFNKIKYPLFESYCRMNKVNDSIANIKIGDFPVKARVASEYHTIMRGYQKRPEPVDNEGILFIYPYQQKMSFWMKDVPFSLDIMFFDENMKMIYQTQMHPEKDNLPPYTTYDCPLPAKYVLEVRKDWCKERNISTNSNISLKL